MCQPFQSIFYHDILNASHFFLRMSYPLSACVYAPLLHGYIRTRSELHVEFCHRDTERTEAFLRVLCVSVANALYT